MRFLLRIADAIDWCNERVARGVAWLTVAMVLCGAYNAVVRKVHPEWSSNTYLELQWYMFSLIFLLSAGYTLQQNAHVRVDVLYGRLSERGKAAINLAGSVLFLIPFTLVVLWVSGPWVRDSWANWEVSPNPGGLWVYPIKTVIPIAFGLLLLQGVAQAIRHTATLFGIKRDDTAETESTAPPEASV